MQERGSNLPRVGDYNQVLVVDLVRRHPGISRVELTQRTGLSGQTVSNLCRRLVEQGLMLATALAPEIGYDAAAALAKEAHKSGRSIRELAAERGIAPERLDELLDPASMTEPGLGRGPGGG